MMKEKYLPETYWEQRLSNNLDITTVGQTGLGYIYNSWLYRARFYSMNRALKKLDLNVKSKSLIDIGVGSGAWIPFWQKNNVSEIVGLDITSSSICSLKKRYPQYQFIKSDICGTSQNLMTKSFDIVTAFDILFHITDDNNFFSAVRNLSNMVKHNGWLIISDSFCDRPWGPFYHEYHRSYDRYLVAFHSVGLKPIHMEPIFYTMTQTLCDMNSLYKHILSRFTKVLHHIVRIFASRSQTEWINHLIGCSLYFLDGIIHQMDRNGNSLKLLFIQKG